MTMRLWLYFYCFSEENEENVKRTDQFGSDLDYEKVGTVALDHVERFISCFFLLVYTQLNP